MERAVIVIHVYSSFSYSDIEAKKTVILARIVSSVHSSFNIRHWNVCQPGCQSQSSPLNRG